VNVAARIQALAEPGGISGFAPAGSYGECRPFISGDLQEIVDRDGGGELVSLPQQEQAQMMPVASRRCRNISTPMT